MRGVDTARLAAVATRHRGPLALAGGAVSLFVGIYSDEARAMLAWTWTHVAAGGTLVAAGVAAVFSTAWWARGRVERRRELQREVTPQSFEIRADDFDGDLPSDQAVIGRELRYLERRTSSSHLVVLLHGLGLDAEDFRPYMNRARQHTIAITAFGHNVEEARDSRYGPIGLATHTDLISGAVNNLCRQYPHKKLTLVGFSVGADMLFRLAALWTAHPDRKPKVTAALLLDPNINHSTMIITGSAAQMNPDDPLTELKRIANVPRSPVEFQNVCEYLHKITEKDLHQVQRYASELWADWEPEGRYDLFFRRFDQLQAMSGSVKIFFSTHFERHFNEVVGLARQRGVRRVFDLRRVDHFELCRETFLVREVDALTRRR